MASKDASVGPASTPEGLSGTSTLVVVECAVSMKLKPLFVEWSASFELVSPQLGNQVLNGGRGSCTFPRLWVVSSQSGCLSLKMTIASKGFMYQSELSGSP